MQIATRGTVVFCLIAATLFASCSRQKTDDESKTITGSGSPADTYFSLAVTDDSHNHTGAKLLFLDFQVAKDIGAVRNNVVISPQVARDSMTLDGDAKEWDTASLTTIKGLPQNNYPLSEFIDAQATDITMGSAWDEDYIYFLVQWEDAGHTASTQMKKWDFDGAAWRAKTHRGVTSSAPNANAVNRGHLLMGNEDEDRVLMMFPIQDGENNFAPGRLGCAAYCHANLKLDNPKQNYTGAGVSNMHTNLDGDRADVWHWKSTRTAPSGYADDGFIGFAAIAANGHQADSGDAAYRENNLNGMPAFQHQDAARRAEDSLREGDAVAVTGSPTAGDSLPAYISLIPSGSRADVQSRHRYDEVTNRWTVEFRRARVTGNTDDRQFGAEGTAAAPPNNSAVGTADSVAGGSYFFNNCRGCHGIDGEGSTFGYGWSVPRNQRASGSLILKAVRTVGVMDRFKEISEQDAENIAAFLQTKASFVEQRKLKIALSGVPANVAAHVVVSDPAGIDCQTSCEYSFIVSSSLTLTAKDIPGYRFAGWSGSSCSGTTVCTVVLNNNTDVTASYTPVTAMRALTVSTVGDGTVTCAVNGTAVASCNTSFLDGTRVTLHAVPAANSQFKNWSGACSGTTDCVLTLSAATSATANFEAKVIPTCSNGAVLFDGAATSGFGRQMIAESNQISAPTDMAFVPGSNTDFMVVNQGGVVNYFQGECNLINSVNISGAFTAAVPGINVVAGGEQGLLNIEFHPDYATNKFVFFYHTSIGNTVNSISRMTVSFAANGALVLSDPQRIIDFRKENSNNDNHNGGGLTFMLDKTLLASIGDGGGTSASAQKDTTLLGKVIRIQPDLRTGVGGYTIPSGNMFDAALPLCHNSATNSGKCPEILAKGLRNPFRLSNDGNAIYIGDVGAGYEEMNSFLISNNSANFGWPTCDGPGACSIATATSPILSYSRDTGTASYTNLDNFRKEDTVLSGAVGSTNNAIMLGGVYRGGAVPVYPANAMPNGTLMFGEYYVGFIRGVQVDNAGAIINDNVGAPGFHILHKTSTTSMLQGPDGYMYLTVQPTYGTTTIPAGIYRLVYRAQ